MSEQSLGQEDPFKEVEILYTPPQHTAWLRGEVHQAKANLKEEIDRQYSQLSELADGSRELLVTGKAKEVVGEELRPVNLCSEPMTLIRAVLVEAADEADMRVSLVLADIDSGNVYTSDSESISIAVEVEERHSI